MESNGHSLASARQQHAIGIRATNYRRDRNQRITREDTAFSGAQASAGRSKAFTLDSLGRLTGCLTRVRQVTGGPVTTESDVRYTYDLEGRRLTATGGLNSGSYTQDTAIPPGDHQASQYTTWRNGDPLIWDDNGCLTSFSSSTAHFDLVYDSNSRLVAVNDPLTGASIATYAFDGVGRRTRSTVFGSDPVVPPDTTYFVYDDDAVVQELGEDGLANFTFANGSIGGICIISRNGTLVYPHGGGTARESAKPYNGHTTTLKAIARGGNGTYLITNSAGDVVERLDRDDACRPIFLTSDGIVRPGATSTLSGLRWLAPECAWCPETGLFQCSGGVYSPALGRDTSAHYEKKKEKATDSDLKCTYNVAAQKKV